MVAEPNLPLEVAKRIGFGAAQPHGLKGGRQKNVCNGLGGRRSAESGFRGEQGGDSKKFTEGRKQTGPLFTMGHGHHMCPSVALEKLNPARGKTLSLVGKGPTGY